MAHNNLEIRASMSMQAMYNCAFFSDRPGGQNARKEDSEQKEQGQKSLPKEGCQEQDICPKKNRSKETQSHKEEACGEEIVAEESGYSEETGGKEIRWQEACKQETAGEKDCQQEENREEETGGQEEGIGKRNPPPGKKPPKRR
jgi:hypothetical protein